MHSRFYSLGNPRSSGQLQSLSHYRDQALQLKQNAAAVDEDGSLLEYEALELRIHPPNVRIDNDNPHYTVLIIDSANRPGTLVEVVQCLTELGLSVKQARISSDGGWFVDEFHVSETPSGCVTDPKKIAAIKQVLALPEPTGDPAEVHTVFQIAGPETPGLLAEVTQLLSHNGLEIRTAAAWTYNKRAAIVIGVTEHTAAVMDHVKLHRLQQLLLRLVEKTGDKVAVSVEQVEGPVHHERRLHQLLLADEVQAWKQLSRLQRQHSLPFPGPVNTHGPAVDSDTEADQVPTTPQQQWQRQMLPPFWSVDSGGRPVQKEDLRQHIQQQQQQQEQEQEQGQQSGQQLQQHVEATHSDAPAPNTPDQALPTAATDVTLASAVAAHGADVYAFQTSAAGTQSQPGCATAPAVAAVDDDKAAGAAAAQQASVDKLIALLQPQALVHSVSVLPSSPKQKQAAAFAADATAAVHLMSERSVQRDEISPACNFQRRQTAEILSDTRPPAAQHPEQQHKLEVEAAPEPQLAAAPPGDLTAATAYPNTAADKPPRGPAAQTRAGAPPPSHLLLPEAPGDACAEGTRPAPSTRSAPTSPNIGARHTGGTAAAPSWTPGALASASAAAGLLSPRGVPATHAVRRSLDGMAGTGVFGLQQQQQQQQQQEHARQGSAPLTAPMSSVLDAPEVQIQHSHLFNYWLVEIHCRDRNKLFFDTVCTLSDMRFDIYHATIDTEPSGLATQLFYIRPRFGECVWDEHKASVLRAMLVSAVQRRFPPGLRLHVFSGSTVCLQDLVLSFKRQRLTITRCKVRAYDHATHTFYLLNHDGSLPSRQYVQVACQAAGGELVEAALDVSNPCVSTVLRSLDARGRFAFSFVNQRAQLRSCTVPSRGVHAPDGPMDAYGFLAGRGDAAGQGGVRRGVLQLTGLAKGDGVRGVVNEQHKQTGAADASYNSDQQPSF